MNVDAINLSELKRIDEVKAMNDPVLHVAFECDKTLLKHDPKGYWNTFLLLDVPCMDEEEQQRENLIIKMQKYYAERKHKTGVQLNLF